ncbi:helix-turn-helix domain-containing protein [Streptomyces sp. 12297]|uniref:AraC family transcriptional regulator n=1 Tax=Streptomyces sp. NBC_00239 TaxID=2903640 RepID=UPI002E283936|nr:helix-turn-helix domain-containing protein [Streptomyces sp. NBC_00239]
MWATVSSDELPAGDRFDWFSDMVAREVVPTAISSERPAEFRAEAAVLDLGELRVSRLAYAPLRSRRTPALIRRGDPEQYQLAMVSKGSMVMSQHGNECHAHAGDLVFWDTSRPSDARAPAPDAPDHQLVILQLPRNALPLQAHRLDRLLARRIPGGSGTAAMLASFMSNLVDHGDQCAPAELGRLGAVAADLAATCLAQHLGAGELLPAEVRARAQLRRIHAFIEHHLGDPDLSPSVIAARHSMSVRSLHQLFRNHGHSQDRPEKEKPNERETEKERERERESVHALIRRRRLERCRADLARTGPRAHPVGVIAARWGFSGPAVFSRSFREAYGLSPSEFRALSVKEARAERTTRRTPPS